MSRWGELVPHDEEAMDRGRCLCGCCDETDEKRPVSERVEYIRRRLDELEAAAKAIHRDGCTWVVQRQYYPCDYGVPAAVLARVAADRKMLDLERERILDAGGWDKHLERSPLVRLMAEGLGWKDGGDE